VYPCSICVHPWLKHVFEFKRELNDHQKASTAKAAASIVSPFIQSGYKRVQNKHTIQKRGAKSYETAETGSETLQPA
jgi:hypothetical protein